MIESLHHIAIICSDEEKALKFYRDALGFAISARYERPAHHDVILMLTGYDMTLELFMDATHPARVDRPEALGLRHLALKVTDIEQVIARLRDNGFIAEPLRRDTFTGDKMTFVKDPDGLPIELHE